MAKKKQVTMASRKRANKTNSRRSIVKWSAVSLGVLSLVGTVIWYGMQQNWSLKAVEPPEQLMPIRVVEIRGELRHLSKDTILSVLRSQSRETSEDKQTINFMTTDLSDIEAELEALPWVYRSKIRRIWPDKLIIDIDEQQAIAIWNDNRLVNQFGQTFEPETIAIKTIPKLSGPEHELESLLQLFADLQTQFEAEKLQLSEMHLSERRAWELKLSNGIILDIGRKALSERVTKFINIYPILVNDDPAPIERVDLRYDTGMAVTRMPIVAQDESGKP